MVLLRLALVDQAMDIYLTAAVVAAAGLEVAFDEADLFHLIQCFV